MKNDKIFDVWRKNREAQLQITPKDNKPNDAIMPQELTPTTDVNQAQDIAQKAGDPATQDFNLQPNEPQPEMSPAAPIDTPPSANREQQVKDSVGELAGHISAIANSVYQMNLTTNQSQELTTKVVTMISDYISNITVERVKNIAEEFMKVEAKKRIALAAGQPFNEAERYRKIIASLSKNSKA